ncbi:MAG: hypothetical protein JOZ96_00350 [Acidobacteria bacterium]|nr:hypothetical protein [Acidobacteriota bacterium]
MLKNLRGVLARLLLAAALVCASAAFSLAVPRAGGAGSCAMSRMHDCCERSARKAAEAPRLLPVRLCCVTNTPQPAPAGTNYNSQPAPGAATEPRPAAAAAAPAHVTPRAPTQPPAFSPTHSPPAYIRHASFLI